MSRNIISYQQLIGLIPDDDKKLHEYTKEDFVWPMPVDDLSYRNLALVMFQLNESWCEIFEAFIRVLEDHTYNDIPAIQRAMSVIGQSMDRISTRTVIQPHDD